jgi:hypothetical protein
MLFNDVTFHPHSVPTVFSSFRKFCISENSVSGLSWLRCSPCFVVLFVLLVGTPAYYYPFLIKKSLILDEFIIDSKDE